jgi:hypothetical protein
VGNPKVILWVFIGVRDGRMRRRPEAYETFAEAQDAFKRHTGVDWMDSFSAFEGYEGFYPGEIMEGPARGSKILPVSFRPNVAARRDTSVAKRDIV